MRFTYKYFMPNYFNFVQIGTQEKYNDMLDNHRKTIEASWEQQLIVPEYIHIEVEVELRVV